MAAIGAGAQFYLYPVSGSQVAGLGTHIAFAADSHAAVDGAYAAALAGGAKVVRPAGALFQGCSPIDVWA